MDVLIRADASIDIGTGHVMRCLALAEALRAKGATCGFICRRHEGNLIDLIQRQGFEVHGLSILKERVGEDSGNGLREQYEKWLGADWASDARQTREILGGNRTVDWMIVDHYALDSRWERELRASCRRVMVIDDLADRPHECDLLLDQNLGRLSGDYADLVSGRCRVLAGPQFALLRQEFAALRRPSTERRETSSFKRLLVSMGGVDKGNATGQVLETLKQCSLPSDSRVTVALGAHAPSLQEVSRLAASMPWKTEVRVDIKDIGNVMAESDLAIGAAGTMAWERCCLGLPTLAIVLADNQRRGAEALAACGAAFILDLGSLASELPEKLALLLSGDNLKQMQRACLAVTGGNGIDEVVELLVRSRD